MVVIDQGWPPRIPLDEEVSGFDKLQMVREAVDKLLADGKLEPLVQRSDEQPGRGKGQPRTRTRVDASSRPFLRRQMLSVVGHQQSWGGGCRRRKKTLSTKTELSTPEEQLEIRRYNSDGEFRGAL